jgi:D-alanyl-D-alanine carboxypeptidase
MRTTVCAAVLALGVVTACATGTEPITSTPPSASTAIATALKTIDPKALQDVVAASAEKLMVPGAMVVLRTPQGEFTAAVGTTDLAAATPPTPNTHFRIASNTKTMTAALIVLLAQDGKLRFTDPVSAYVPDVPGGQNITVGDLLMMRSGLYNYTADPAFAAAMDADPDKAWTAQEALGIAFRHPSPFAPGAEYEYNNTNYALLGLIAEKVGGRPLAEQLQDRIFGPVGLDQTSLPALDDTAIPAPYSHGYMYGPTRYALADEPYPADMQAAIRSGDLHPIDYTNQNPSYAHAAGGAISTADDLATWMKALVSGRLFNADFAAQWLASPQAEDPAAPDGQKYGYGISYQRFGPHAAMYYHGGELPGFNSFMGHDPDNDVTLVIWTNLTLSPTGETTANALLPVVLKEIYAELSF